MRRIGRAGRPLAIGGRGGNAQNKRFSNCGGKLNICKHNRFHEHCFRTRIPPVGLDAFPAPRIARSAQLVPGFAHSPGHPKQDVISDPQPSEGPRAAELQSRIDPNAADWKTLAAIPNLGEKRAKAIVAYRDGIRSRNAKCGRLPLCPLIFCTFAALVRRRSRTCGRICFFHRWTRKSAVTSGRRCSFRQRIIPHV